MPTFVQVSCGKQWGHRVDVLRCPDFESVVEPFQCDPKSLLILRYLVKLEQAIKSLNPQTSGVYTRENTQEKVYRFRESTISVC